MNNFLEENSKWIVRVLVFVGMFLIVKLWWFWVHSYFHIFNVFFDYYWTNAWYIAVILLIFSFIWILIIRKIDNKVNKVQIAFLIFLFWVFSQPLFYIVSPDFKFYFTNEYKKYKTEDDKVLDIDLYLEYMWKYCNNNIDDFKFKRVFREDMCAGKYLYDFETIEEYAKVFDFANKNNLRNVYRLTYLWAKDFWLEKIIEGYNDDTFYGYIIDKTSDLKIINVVKNNINDDKFINILEKYIYSINYFFNNSNLFNQNNWEKYWNSLSIDIEDKLKEIPEINYKIF